MTVTPVKLADGASVRKERGATVVQIGATSLTLVRTPRPEWISDKELHLSTVSLSVTEWRPGLFALLDLNRDGAPSPGELRLAPDILRRLGVKTLTPGDVPRRLRLSFGLGGDWQ